LRGKESKYRGVKANNENHDVMRSTTMSTTITSATRIMQSTSFLEFPNY